MPYVERVRAADARILSGVLPDFVIELTERCNNDCVHCSINRGAGDAEARARELTAGEIRGILAEAAELGCLSVRLTGGEPLLRPDFEEIYLAARGMGIKVSLFTNARLITPRLAALFGRIPPLVPIDISVYGMRAESYEAVSRVPGSFEGFRRGVSLLLEAGVPFTVKMPVLPANRKELAEFDAWAAGLPGSRGPRVIVQLQLRDRRDDSAKSHSIERLRLSPAECAEVMSREAASGAHMVRFCEQFAGRPGDALFKCGFGRSPCVDAYGRLQGCLGLRAASLAYDLRRGSLRDAILNFLPALAGMRASDPAYLERCARCFIKSLCEQCPATAWAETGALDKPSEYHCRVAHEQARQLGLLGTSENAWEVLDFRPRIEVLKEDQRWNRMEATNDETEVEPAGVDGHGSQQAR